MVVAEPSCDVCWWGWSSWIFDRADFERNAALPAKKRRKIAVEVMSDDRETSCVRKVQHGTKFAAEQEALRLETELRKSFTSYWCPFCQHYHVGSTYVE